MSLVSDLENLFITKEDSDVTFIIKNEEVYGHKSIVTARSPVLKRMIIGPMAPENQKHKITDPQVTAENFNNFLKFLYTEKCEINHENVEVMLHLSHMYDVPGLFEMCVNKLPQFFSTTSPLKYAQLGILYDNKSDILVICLNEIPNIALNSQLQFLNDQNEMIWISPELAVEFVKRCPRTSIFTEDVVFQKIYDWAKGRCELQKVEINSENLKEIMAPLVPYLNLEKMDMKIITSLIYKFELIPEKRLLKCYHDYIVKKESENASYQYPVYPPAFPHPYASRENLLNTPAPPPFLPFRGMPQLEYQSHGYQVSPFLPPTPSSRFRDSLELYHEGAHFLPLQPPLNPINFNFG